MIAEDDFANQLGTFTLELVGNRARRLMHLLRGWPHLMYKAASSEDAQGVVNLFHADLELMKAWDAEDPKCSELLYLLSRNTFNVRSVKQLEAAFEELSYDANSANFVDLKEMLLRKASINKQSLVVEEAFGAMKNPTKTGPTLASSRVQSSR